MRTKVLGAKVLNQIATVFACGVLAGLPQKVTAQIFTDKNYVKINPTDTEADIIRKAANVVPSQGS